MLDITISSFNLSILYILFGILIVLVEFLRKRERIFDFLTLANGYFMLVYIITPLYFLLTLESHYGSIYNSKVFFTSFFAYSLMVLGWRIHGSSYKIQSYNLSTQNKIHFDLKIYRILFFTLIGMSILTLVYFFGLGGLQKALSSGALMRYAFEETQIGNFSYLARVVAMVPLIGGFYFYFILEPPKFKNLNNIKILFFISIIVSLLRILVGASRGAFLNLFLMQLLIYLKIRNTINVRATVVMSLLIVIFVMYGKQVFFATATMISGGDFSEAFSYMSYTRGTSDKAGVELILREYQHVIHSLNAAFTNAGVNISYTYFNDWFWSVLRVIPQKITQIFIDRPDTISFINTGILINRLETSIPPGIVASFYYSLGNFGVILGMFLYGYYGRKLNNNLLALSKVDAIYYVPFTFLAFVYGGFIVNGDPNIYIYHIIWPVFFYVLIRRIQKKYSFSELKSNTIMSY